MEPIKISSMQAVAFNKLTALLQDGEAPPHYVSAKRAELWAIIRREHGLPASEKYKVQCLDPTGNNYLVIRHKRTGEPVGLAKSHTPYGCALIQEVIPFLGAKWDEAVTVPLDAQPIGGGLFVHQGKLYFPNF